MLRMLFLLLVIVGAFAVVFGVVLGVGVMRMSAHAPAAVALGPSPQPVVAPAAAAPAAVPAMAVLAPPPITPASLPPAPPVADGRIVLKPGDAALKGDYLRIMPNGDLRFGARKGVSAVWQIFDAPAGDYHVDLTYSADDDGGGEIIVQVSQDGGDSFTADIEPTGSAAKYKTVRPGTLHFTGKRKAGLIIRSRRVRDEDLMRLRKVELVPLEPAAVPAAARPRAGK